MTTSTPTAPLPQAARDAMARLELAFAAPHIVRAVTVDANHKTHLQQLMIGRDYGTSLEVLQGLKPDDWIVLNPPDSLDEGLQVNVKVVSQNPPPASQTGNAPPPAPGNKPPANNNPASSGNGAKK